MGPEFLVPIVAIGGFYATIIAVKALNVEAIKHRGMDNRRLETELAALRQEMASLKAWANTLILSFDTTLQQHSARLQSVERRALESDLGRDEALPEQERLELRSGV